MVIKLKTEINLDELTKTIAYWDEKYSSRNMKNPCQNLAKFIKANTDKIINLKAVKGEPD